MLAPPKSAEADATAAPEKSDNSPEARAARPKLHAVEEPRSKPLAVKTFSEIVSSPPAPRRWLIKGVLRRNHLSIMWGESGCGKTQAALDLALHLALGWDWRGRKVKEPVGVLFVAAEGGDGILDRVNAWVLHHRASALSAPFGVITSPIDLASGDKDHRRLEEAVEEAERGFEVPIGLVILDTLNATAPGADENAAGPMSAYLNNVRGLRNGSGRHVMILHHCGKVRERGMRGSTALLGAVDEEFEVLGTRRSKLFTLALAKERDGTPDVEEWHYEKRPVKLGVDEDGDPVTAVCAVHSEKGPETALSAGEDRVLNILRDEARTTGQVVFTRREMNPRFKDALFNPDKEGDVPKAPAISQRITRTLKALVKAQLIELEGEGSGQTITLLDASCE